MKKILSVICLLLVITGCTQSTGDVELKESPGKYQIFNSLGEKITELYLYETGKDKGSNRVGDNGLEKGGYIILTAEGTETTKLTLEYIAESGDTGKIESLRIEEVPVNILAPDARTGPTVVEFIKAKGEGVYDIYNLTGGTVTELYVFESGTDPEENYAGEDGIPSDGYVQVVVSSSMDKTWCIEFKADNGEEGKYEHLAITHTPISLLAKSDRKEKAPISFTKPE